IGFVELVQKLLAAAELQPSLVLARVETERNSGAEREGRVLTDVVVRCGAAHLDRAVLHRVEHLQARHDLAGGESADLEFVVGRLRYDPSEPLARSPQGIKRLRKARRKAPVERRHRLGDGWCTKTGAGDSADAQRRAA